MQYVGVTNRGPTGKIHGLVPVEQSDSRTLTLTAIQRTQPKCNMEDSKKTATVLGTLEQVTYFLFGWCK